MKAKAPRYYNSPKQSLGKISSLESCRVREARGTNNIGRTKRREAQRALFDFDHSRGRKKQCSDTRTARGRKGEMTKKVQVIYRASI